MERLKANFLFKEDESIIRKMRDDYLSSPKAVKYLTQTLKVPQEVIDDNIVMISNFVDDLNYCSKCPGIDKCAKDSPYLCNNLVYKKGVLSREIIPCKKILKDMEMKAKFTVRDFPDEWLKSELSKIDKSSTRKLVIDKFHDFLKEEVPNEWIYLKGEGGTGRTFLAANLAIELSKKDKGNIAFIDVPARFKELAGKKDHDAFEALLNKYTNVPVLVLDDLGNEYTSEFIRESILFPILNGRIKNHLFTIITSDFSVDELMVMYCKNQSSKPKIDQMKRLLKKVIKQEFNLGEISIY